MAEGVSCSLQASVVIIATCLDFEFAKMDFDEMFFKFSPNLLSLWNRDIVRVWRPGFLVSETTIASDSEFIAGRPTLKQASQGQFIVVSFTALRLAQLGERKMEVNFLPIKFRLDGPSLPLQATRPPDGTLSYLLLMS